MNKQRWTLTLLLAVGVWRAAGQTTVDLSRQGKLGAGTVLPVRCTVGQMFLKTDAPPGANLYVCTASPGTWAITGITALGGDATGTQQSLTVKGIQGRGVSPASPTDQNVLRWNASAAQWEPGSAPSGLAQSSVINPTLGGASDLSALSWTVGHDDIASTPGWSDASAWSLTFRPWMGQQDYDNASKRTFNTLKLLQTPNAAGQHEGLASQMYIYGVGDAAGLSVQIQGGSQNSGGDEGTHGLRAELIGEQSATRLMLGTMPPQTTCGTGATITQQVWKATAPQTVTVSSSSGCAIGDHVIVARGTPLSPTTEEMIVLTGVSPGQITAKFNHDQASGAKLSPATKLNVGNAAGLGQLRWLRRVGHEYTVGQVSGISGNTLTGSGTSWSSSVFGGDATAPALISLDTDTNTGQAAGLRAWFWITSVTSPTSMTVSNLRGVYSGLGVVPSNYSASCGAVIVGFDTPADVNSLGPYVYVDTPPGVCGWTAGDTVEMTVPVQNGQWGASTIVRNYVNSTQVRGGGYHVMNQGDTIGQAAFLADAPSFLFPSGKPAFDSGLAINAPLNYGIAFSSSIEHELLVARTYTGKPAPISWSAGTGKGSAIMQPDTANGDLQIFSNSGNLRLGSISNGNLRYTLDSSMVTGSRNLKIPNHDGVLLTDADVPISTVIKTLPASVGDAITLGSFGGTGYSPRIYDVYIQLSDATASKRYTLAVDNPTATGYKWGKVVPISQDITGATDFDLDYLQSGGDPGTPAFRLRKTAGSGTPDATVLIYCYSTSSSDCAFTPSQSAPGTVTAPTVYLANTVLSQVAGHLATFGSAPSLSGCGSGASLSPNSNDEGGTLTLGTTPGACVVSFAHAYSTWAPKCTVTFQAGVPGPYSLSTTAISISATGLTGKVDYRCAQ